MMTILVKREILHQLIDDLPEPQLVEVAKYVEFLLAKDQSGTSKFDLWVLTEEDSLASLDDLDELVHHIKNTPYNAQAVTLSVKSWSDYAAEMPQTEEVLLDVAAWNASWDAVEAEMESASVAHEKEERQE